MFLAGRDYLLEMISARQNVSTRGSLMFTVYTTKVRSAEVRLHKFKSAVPKILVVQMGLIAYAYRNRIYSLLELYM